jgi:hypothetical protein
VRIVSPEGRVHVPRAPLAPAVADLAGKRIAVLDNGKPNAALLLSEIARRIAARTDAEVAFVIAKGTAATPAEPEILQQLETADLVLTGSAD